MRTGTQKGFTLIELLITVVIVGILAAIAYPAYTEHIQRGYRADAKGVLLENAQVIERVYSENNSYASAPLGYTQSPKTGTPRYNIGWGASSPGVSDFVIQAAPVGTDRCGTLTLNNLGAKGITGAATGVTAAQCW